jgi:uncharacterized protein (DUF2252 family)
MVARALLVLLASKAPLALAALMVLKEHPAPRVARAQRVQLVSLVLLVCLVVLALLAMSAVLNGVSLSRADRTTMTGTTIRTGGRTRRHTMQTRMQITSTLRLLLSTLFV